MLCFIDNIIFATEIPDEPYDSRSLFERLQEQKDKKQQEFEDAIKFSEYELLSFLCEGFMSFCTKP